MACRLRVAQGQRSSVHGARCHSQVFHIQHGHGLVLIGHGAMHAIEWHHVPNNASDTKPWQIVQETITCLQKKYNSLSRRSRILLESVRLDLLVEFL